MSSQNFQSHFTINQQNFMRAVVAREHKFLMKIEKLFPLGLSFPDMVSPYQQKVRKMRKLKVKIMVLEKEENYKNTKRDSFSVAKRISCVVIAKRIERKLGFLYVGINFYLEEISFCFSFNFFLLAYFYSLIYFKGSLN